MVSICRICGCEKVLGKTESEVVNESDDGVLDFLERWTIEKPGFAAIMSKAMYLECHCLEVEGLEVFDYLIREPYRTRVREAFGTDLTYDTLMSLPSEWVAWQNSPLVTVGPTGRFDISYGTSLLQHVRECYANGIITERYTEEEIEMGTQYLSMILPEYRVAAVTELGWNATLVQVLKRIPVAWYDWERIPDLFVEGTDGAFKVGEFSKKLGLAHCMREYYTLNTMPKYSVLGSYVAFMDYADSTVQVAVLRNGVSYVPSGSVTLEVREALVYVPLGWDVLLPRGTRLKGDKDPVVLWVNGALPVVFVKTGERAREGVGVRYAVELRTFEPSEFPATAVWLKLLRSRLEGMIPVISTSFRGDIVMPYQCRHDVDSSKYVFHYAEWGTPLRAETSYTLSEGVPISHTGGIMDHLVHTDVSTEDGSVVFTRLPTLVLRGIYLKSCGFGRVTFVQPAGRQDSYVSGVEVEDMIGMRSGDAYMSVVLQRHLDGDPRWYEDIGYLRLVRDPAAVLATCGSTPTLRTLLTMPAAWFSRELYEQYGLKRLAFTSACTVSSVPSACSWADVVASAAMWIGEVEEGSWMSELLDSYPGGEVHEWFTRLSVLM